MTIRDTFGGAMPVETAKPSRNEAIRGTIFHLGNGYGFIESPAIPYTRIFFHWQNLDHDTLHFTKLKRGMELEFVAIEEKNLKSNKMEWRAQKVRVVDNG
jgi:hypothetical protein